MHKAVVFCLFVAALAASKAQALIKTETSQAAYRLKVEFTLKKDGRVIEQHAQVVVPMGNSEWVPLTKAEDGVALLGKVYEVRKGVVQAEYMVVDTASSPVGIKRMGVISKFESPTELDSAFADKKIKILMTASPTFVTTKPDFE